MVVYHEDRSDVTRLGPGCDPGLEVGAKILSIEPKDELPARSPFGLLEDRPEAVEAMGSGPIQVIPADRAAYDPHVGPLIRILRVDPERGLLTEAPR